MILSRQSIWKSNILTPCYERKEQQWKVWRKHADEIYRTTVGLGPAGYDLSLSPEGMEEFPDDDSTYELRPGEFKLFSAIERFTMPDDVIGFVKDKSSLARRGISVFNTVIEPGWEGYLTLEIKNHGNEPVVLFAGQGICQVIFQRLDEPTDLPYNGKYQGQGPEPVEAI